MVPFQFLTDLFSFTEEDATAGGIATKLFDIVLLPYNLAINFLRGIFGFGADEEGNVEPFSLGSFIVDTVQSAIDFIKDLFNIDFKQVAGKLVDIGASVMLRIKAIGAGALAASKAIAPFGKSPTEAFKERYDEYMQNNSPKAPVDSLMTQDDVLEISSDESLKEKEEILTKGALNSLDNQEKIANMFGRNSLEYKAEVMKFNAIDNKLSEVQNEQMDRETSGSVTVVNQDNSQNNNTSNSSTEQTPGLAATENDYTAKALSAFASGRYAGGF